MEQANEQDPQSFRLRLPRQLHTEAKDQAWRERRSLNDLITEAVRRHVAERSAAAG